MRLLIQTQGLLISREERDLFRTRLQTALSRFGQTATAATLHLQDINGPKGGLDKDCKLIIELQDGTAVITDRGSDLRSVVNRTIHRAVQSIRRQIQQQKVRARDRISLRSIQASRLARRRMNDARDGIDSEE